jgi:DNA polymerase III epsilon subunit-like protein/very-short-patch-repair endonuclease
MEYHNHQWKKVFWEQWQAQNNQELSPTYTIGNYTADFAHLPTKTIIEIDRIFPDTVRDQVKRAGWQIVQIQGRDLEQDIQACIQKASKLLANKTIYLQKKGQANLDKIDSEQLEYVNKYMKKTNLIEPIIRYESITIKKDQRTCPTCGRPLFPYEQRCYTCRTYEYNKRERQETIKWAKELVHRSDWLVFDTETTGFTKTAEIVEIAVLDSQGKPLLNTLIKPRRHIPLDASKVHGIYDQDTAKAPTFAEVWSQISHYFQNNLILAYNASYDLRMLLQTAQLYRISLPQTLKSACIMKKCISYLRAENDNPPSSPSLIKVCNYLGIAAAEKHRAIDDAYAAWQIIGALGEVEES